MKSKHLWSDLQPKEKDALVYWWVFGRGYDGALHPSTKISDAWVVVENMQNSPPRIRDAFFRLVDSNGLFACREQGAASKICLAALLAIGCDAIRTPTQTA